MQDSTKRKGRPREFDERKARRQVMETFWERGLTGVSLDDLSEATGMKRPSLYGAFGNKEAMYLEALRQFAALFRPAATRLLQSQECRTGLEEFFQGALELYGTRGCLLVCTASTEAPRSPAVREVLACVLTELDELMASYFSRFFADGPRRGRLAASLLHSLAVRTRARLGAEELQQLVREAVDFLCR